MGTIFAACIPEYVLFALFPAFYQKALHYHYRLFFSSLIRLIFQISSPNIPRASDSVRQTGSIAKWFEQVKLWGG